MSVTYNIQLTQQQFDDLNTLMERGRDDLDYSLSSLDRGDYLPEEIEDHERLNEAGYDAVCEAINARTALWSTSCGTVELDVPIRVVESVAVAGDNEPAVIAAIEEHGHLRAQLKRMNMVAAANNLRDAGLEQFDENGEARNDAARIMNYTLWTACHDINDEIHTED